MNRRFWRIVTVVTVWHVAASVCYYTVYAGTPLFRDTFALSGVEVGFVIAALTAGYALSLLPFGVATDRYGERVTLTLGLFGLALGTTAVALAPNYPLLLTAAVLLGSMYGSATPGTNKAIFDRVDPGLQHRAIGIKQIGPTVGSAAGALLVTGLAGLYFRQAGFFAAAGIGLVVAVAFGAVYRGATQDAGAYPDFRGLVSNRTFVVLLASGVCLGAAFYTTTGYTVLFVEESIGATVAVGGLVLAAVQIAGSAANSNERDPLRSGRRRRGAVPGASAGRDAARGGRCVRRSRRFRARRLRAVLLLSLDARGRRATRGGVGRGPVGRHGQRPVRAAGVRLPRRRGRLLGRLGAARRTVVSRGRIRVAGGVRPRVTVAHSSPRASSTICVNSRAVSVIVSYSPRAAAS